MIRPISLIRPGAAMRLTSHLPLLLACFVCVAVAFGLARIADADTFLLRGGGEFRGEIVNKVDRDNKTFLQIVLADGGHMEIDRRMIQTIREESAAEKEYKERLKGLADTVDAHLEMATWCDDHRLRKENEYHLLRVLKLDPGNEIARHRLGFSRINGKWVLVDQWNMSQGYLRHEGQWKIPQVIAVETALEERELAEKEWRKLLKRWRTAMSKRNAEEAVANIREIRDPAAVPGIVEMLETERNDDVKLLLIETLSKIGSGNFLGPLIHLSLHEHDDHVRDIAMKEVMKFKSNSVIRQFMGHLDPNSNPPIVINRAAAALGTLEAEVAVRSLIEALVTKHQVRNPNATNPGQISTGFSDSGGGSFTFGGSGKNQVHLKQSRNTGVLNALRQLTGIDHQFDKQAWLDWYTQQETPAAVNLRRVD